MILIGNLKKRVLTDLKMMMSRALQERQITRQRSLLLEWPQNEQGRIKSFRNKKLSSTKPRIGR